MACDLCITGGRHGCPCCGEAPERWQDRPITNEQAERIRSEVAQGRCSLRANECGWMECARHHPKTVAVAS